MYALAGICVIGVPGVHADRHALLIGIDEYEDLNGINPLSGAAADAEAIDKALTEVANFPTANVRLLTSHGDTKPSRRNILFELEQLKGSVKRDDLVFIFFAGHGVERENVPCLLPYDTDTRTDLNYRDSVLPTSVFRDEIQKIPCKALIMAFDMCRTSPFKEGRGTGPNNPLGEAQARSAVLVSTSPAASPPGPASIVILYACSPRQHSFEWTAKKRGFFSFFLEQGIRSTPEGGAADEHGVVTMRSLLDYLKKAVSGAVAREQGGEQTPYPLSEGADAMQLIIASGRTPQSNGETAVPLAVGNTVQQQFDAAFQRGEELCAAGRYDAGLVKFEDALAIDGRSARATNGAAKCYFHMNNYVGAERLYKRAIELDPRYVNPVNNLGLLYEIYRHDYREAERLYRKAMELDAKEAFPVYNLGRIFDDQKRDDAEAEKLYRKAIGLDPQSALPVNALALLYYSRKKNYAEAEKLFRAATRIDANDGLLHANLALVLLAQNRKAEAVAEAERAVALGYKGPHTIFDKLGLKP